MRAGPLRHLIYADAQIETQGSSGETQHTWSDATTGSATLRAAIDPLSGREQLENAQILASMGTKITVRWTPNVALIDATWRIRHQDTVYDIKSIKHSELGQRKVEFICESGTNNG